MGSSKGLLQEMVAGGAAGGLLGPQPAKVFSRLLWVLNYMDFCPDLPTSISFITAVLDYPESTAPSVRDLQ